MYLLNAFSLQMIEELPTSIKIEKLTEDISKLVKSGKIVSAIGHADTAAVLGVPMNRINVKLHRGDVAIVAQLQGGRLPEGSTTLPEGFNFKFLKVIVED